MASYRTTLFVRRAKKALGILRSKGPREFFDRVRDFMRRRGKIEMVARPEKTLEYDTTPVRFTGKRLDASALSLALEPLKTQPFVLALSQDDYLEVVGGVQLKLADQQNEMNQQGTAFLHLSPYLVRNTLDYSGQTGVMKINLDGQFVGFSDDEAFLTVLEALIGGATLRSVQIHHLMGWKMAYVTQILDLAPGIPVNFWLHDLFSICPNYLLLRNDREYCHAPDPESNACQLCIYGTIRPQHYQAFSDLFLRYPIRAVAPSEFALDLWRQKFPVFKGEGLVIPNARLKWGDRLQETSTGQPLRVAFVGYPVYHKGWQTWLKLTDRFGKDPRYKFFHFSADWQPSPNFEKVSVVVNRQNRTAMTNALMETEIDVAFLWSICPETFSFTLYESLAAGCYIITNPASGNIQNVITNNPQWGSVFKDDSELLESFDSCTVLTDFAHYTKHDRRKAEILYE